MQKTNPHQLTIKIIISISMIWLFFWWWNFAEIIKGNVLVGGIDAMETKDTDSAHFNEMIRIFCTSLWKDWNYDSSQSLFVYNICKKENNPKFDPKKWFWEIVKTSYIKFIKDDNWNELNELDQNLPWFYYNTEDYIQTLFDDIIGSYTSIYQANIYGYSNEPDKSIEDIIHENFAQRYFLKDKTNFIKICSTDVASDSHPKTCKKLKEYFYWARNLINSNTENYLNDQNIKKNLPETCKTDYVTNIVSCWLYWWKTQYFINAVYNELMFYSLFVEYYSYLLQNKSDFKNWDITEYQKKLANNQNRIQTMLNNIETSRKAIQTTIQMLKEIQYTFPIHIGFLMYSEDIYKFTSSMNKTLTPIYTLHDILRNVQKTD